MQDISTLMAHGNPLRMIRSIISLRYLPEKKKVVYDYCFVSREQKDYMFEFNTYKLKENVN